MKLRDFCLTTCAAIRASARSTIAGITADSRKVKPGFLFVAVPGTKADGCASSPQALAAGAVAVMARARAGRAARRRRLRSQVANMRAARWRWPRRSFYPRQPETIAAVTGTSGKTSVAAFTRQIWAALGHQAASIGTVGVVSPKGEVYGSLTTPDPVELHRTLDELAGEGVTHLALEASSHGLDQHRLDGVRIAAGGFTNLSRDHLDYHPTHRGLSRRQAAACSSDLIAPGGTAVIDVDDEHAEQVVAAATAARPRRSSRSASKGDGIKLRRRRDRWLRADH